MNSRAAQDLILRLLADGPFRCTAVADSGSLPADAQAVLLRIDLAGLDRFARFLCRHYYRERVVHYFKYSRALAPLTGRAPEAFLKTAEFTALMPRLILGDRSSAALVLEHLERHLTHEAGSIRARIPYWDDLTRYQSAFFLSDAMPPASSGGAPRRFPMRAETATILDLSYDLPATLPLLLLPLEQLPTPAVKPTRLLFARSLHGEVTVLRCTDALKHLLASLTGEEDPRQLAARMGLAADAFEKTLRQLEQLGAIVAQESFSASHVGSDLPHASTTHA
jgi:hypothetical protein